MKPSLVGLGHGDQPGDLLHLLPRALRREVHQTPEQHGHRTGVLKLLFLAVSLLLRRRDAERLDIFQLRLAVRVQWGVDIAEGGFAHLRGILERNIFAQRPFFLLVDMIE